MGTHLASRLKSSITAKQLPDTHACTSLPNSVLIVSSIFLSHQYYPPTMTFLTSSPSPDYPTGIVEISGRKPRISCCQNVRLSDDEGRRTNKKCTLLQSPIDDDGRALFLFFRTAVESDLFGMPSRWLAHTVRREWKKYTLRH